MTDYEAIEFAEKMVDGFEKAALAGLSEITLYSSEKGIEACKRVIELAKRNPRYICETCKLRRESEG